MTGGSLQISSSPWDDITVWMWSVKRFQLNSTSCKSFHFIDFWNVWSVFKSLQNGYFVFSVISLFPNHNKLTHNYGLWLPLSLESNLHTRFKFLTLPLPWNHNKTPHVHSSVEHFYTIAVGGSSQISDTDSRSFAEAEFSTTPLRSELCFLLEKWTRKITVMKRKWMQLIKAPIMEWELKETTYLRFRYVVACLFDFIGHTSI